MANTQSHEWGNQALLSADDALRWKWLAEELSQPLLRSYARSRYHYWCSVAGHAPLEILVRPQLVLTAPAFDDDWLESQISLGPVAPLEQAPDVAPVLVAPQAPAPEHLTPSPPPAAPAPVAMPEPAAATPAPAVVALQPSAALVVTAPEVLPEPTVTQPGPVVTEPEPTVPAPARARRLGRPSLTTVGFAVFLLLMVGLTAGSLMTSPYVAFTPGETRDSRDELLMNGKPIPAGSGSLNVVVVRFKRLSWVEWLVRRNQKVVDVVGAQQSDSVRLKEIGKDVHNNSIGYAAREALTLAKVPFTYEGDGLLVRGVIFDTPARKLFPATVKTGSIVVAINGKPMRTIIDAEREFKDLRNGDPIHVKLQNGVEFDTKVQTQLGPDDMTGTTKSSGLVLDTWHARTRSKFDFTPVVKDVNGTSAGFAYAIMMYEAITGEDLERGRKIVVTGSIEEESGAILTVDGVRQKVIAAREIGADVIMVSTHDISTALPYVGDVTLLAPRDLKEAIAMLKADDGAAAGTASGAATSEGAPA